MSFHTTNCAVMSFIEKAWENSDQIISEILEARLKLGNDDSFYIFNEKDVISKLEFWHEKFPRVKPFFAMKANHSDLAIRTMARLGTGFDCASKNEIKRILKLDVHPERIIYANPNKQLSHLKFARDNQIEKITFDNVDELEKIKEIFPEAKLVLRIRFDADVSVISFGYKYGCDPEIEAPQLIRKCQELSLNLIGICFHVGFRIEMPEVFDGAIRAAKKLFQYTESIGLKLNFLDIGGGFMGSDMKQVTTCAKFINNAIDECFPEVDVEIISEPGLFFMQTSMKLLCNVHSKRVQKSSDGEVSRVHYFINNGIYTSFLGFALYKIKRIPPKIFRKLKARESPKEYDSVIWGQACTATDILYELRFPEMEIGDWIIVEEVGAYGYCSASEFNGFPKPDIISITVDENS